jgi:hypothetical protein
MNRDPVVYITLEQLADKIEALYQELKELKLDIVSQRARDLTYRMESLEQMLIDSIEEKDATIRETREHYLNDAN